MFKKKLEKIIDELKESYEDTYSDLKNVKTYDLKFYGAVSGIFKYGTYSFVKSVNFLLNNKRFRLFRNTAILGCGIYFGVNYYSPELKDKIIENTNNYYNKSKEFLIENYDNINNTYFNKIDSENFPIDENQDQIFYSSDDLKKYSQQNHNNGMVITNNSIFSNKGNNIINYEIIIRENNIDKKFYFTIKGNIESLNFQSDFSNVNINNRYNIYRN